jgi:hypothetical protein
VSAARSTAISAASRHARVREAAARAGPKVQLVVALVLAKAGQASLQRATPPAPQTVETVKEDRVA